MKGIVVGGIPSSLKIENVKEIFELCGKIEKVQYFFVYICCQIEFYPDSSNPETVNAAIIFAEDTAITSALVLNNEKAGDSLLRVVECPFILPSDDNLTPFESLKQNVTDAFHTIGNKAQVSAQYVDDKLHIKARLTSAATATSNAVTSIINSVKKTLKGSEDNGEEVEIKEIVEKESSVIFIYLFIDIFLRVNLSVEKNQSL